MEKPGLDIAANRRADKYTKAEMLRRILWGLVQPLFRFSPRVFFSYRRLLLRLFGAKIGQEVHIYNSAIIYVPWNLEIGDWSAIGEHAYIYNLGRVSIGEKVTISHRAHLCAGTHDYGKVDLPLLKPSIQIGNQSWICADAFIGPGVTVGEGAIVGARAVVLKDIDPWTVVAGNPAEPIKKRVLHIGQSSTQ
ncbi:MAG: putative colanic acid biosynthesis acetyltransferase [Nitrospirota bacterium]